jgi:hypothetical protein
VLAIGVEEESVDVDAGRVFGEGYGTGRRRRREVALEAAVECGVWVRVGSSRSLG